MKPGYYVDIDISKPISFPTECVVCGKKGDLVSRSLICSPSRQFDYWKLLIGKFDKLTISIHESCGKKANISILMRSLFVLTGGAFILLLVIMMGLDKIYAFYMLVPFLGLIFLWEIYSPLHIDVSCIKNSHLEFAFRDRSYAEKFARLNDVELNE